MSETDLPRPDAPRPIAVVRDFVNTTDHETGIDDLASPADLLRYLRDEGLLDRGLRGDPPRPTPTWRWPCGSGPACAPPWSRTTAAPSGPCPTWRTPSPSCPSA